MSVSKERLHEFMRLYKEEFNEEITEDQASEMTARMLRLYRLVSEELPSERKAREEKNAIPDT